MKLKLLLIILLSLLFLVSPVQAQYCRTSVSISLSPTIVYQGDFVTISGHVSMSHIVIDPTVRLYLDNIRIATVETDAKGDFVYNYRTSSSLAIGPHTIKAVAAADGCDKDYDTATFTVRQSPIVKFEIVDKEPELKVVDVWTSANLECDEIITVNARVRNDGNIVSKEARVSFDIYTDEETNYITNRKVIEADDYEVFSFSYHIPENYDDVLIVKATPKDITGSYNFERKSFDVRCPKEKGYELAPVLEAEDDHCLSIDSMYVDEVIEAGDVIDVSVKVSNCGNVKEDVSSSLEVLSKTHPGRPFTLKAGQTKTINFGLIIPEDASDSEKFKVRVWAADAEDSLSRYFTVFKPSARSEEVEREFVERIVLIDSNVIAYVLGFVAVIVFIVVLAKAIVMFDTRRKPMFD